MLQDKCRKRISSSASRSADLRYLCIDPPGPFHSIKVLQEFLRQTEPEKNNPDMREARAQVRRALKYKRDNGLSDAPIQLRLFGNAAGEPETRRTENILENPRGTRGGGG